MKTRGKRKSQNKLIYLEISCCALNTRLKIQKVRLRHVIIVGESHQDARTKRECAQEMQRRKVS